MRLTVAKAASELKKVHATCRAQQELVGDLRRRLDEEVIALHKLEADHKMACENLTRVASGLTPIRFV